MPIGIWGKPAQLDIQPYDKDFMLRAADAVQKRADKSEADYDALLGDFNKIPALAKDADKRNEIIKSYKQQLSTAYDSAKGDVTKLVPVIRNLGRDFRENLSYGPLAAISGNYNLRKNHEAQVQDAFEKGNINQQRRDALLAMDMEDYQGIGEGSTYGKFNSYQGSTPAKEVDLSEKARKLADAWRADKITRGGYKQDKYGLYFINSKGSKEYVDPDEVYTYVKSVLDQDPEVRSFVDQETRIGTHGVKQDSEIFGTDHQGYPVQISPEAYVNNYRSSFTDKAAKFAAAKEGFMQDEQTQSDLSWNPYALEDYKNKPKHDVETVQGNLNSVRIPQNDDLKVNTQSIGGVNIIPYSKDEIDKMTKEANKNGTQGTVGAIIAGGKQIVNKDDSKVKIPFTSEQLKVLDRAEKEFGQAPATDMEKAKLINKFIEYHNEKLVYPGIQEYNPEDKATMEQATREQAFYFGEKGHKTFINHNFKAIAGDDTKDLTGKEFSDEFGNKKYNKQITGTLSPDNPYYPSGKIVSVFDESGKEVAKYAMEVKSSASNDILHSMYQAKYHATGESEIYLPTANGGKEKLIVKYVDNSKDRSDTGKHYPNVTGAKIEFYHPNDKSPILSVDVDQTPGVDPFVVAYQQLQNLE